GISGTGPLYRSAVLYPRGNFNANLHRRLAFLRRESLARLPQYPAANMRPAETHTTMFYFAGWFFGGISMGIAMYLDAIAFGDPRYAVAFIPGVFLYSLFALFFGAPF